MALTQTPAWIRNLKRNLHFFQCRSFIIGSSFLKGSYLRGKPCARQTINMSGDVSAGLLLAGRHHGRVSLKHFTTLSALWIWVRPTLFTLPTILGFADSPAQTLCFVQQVVRLSGEIISTGNTTRTLIEHWRNQWTFNSWCRLPFGDVGPGAKNHNYTLAQSFWWL